MKYCKILLQLHSIKLVLLTVLAIVFLAMTAINRSNKTETTHADVSIANEQTKSLAAVNLRP